MNPIYQRLAELWMTQQNRPLDVSEMDEFIMIMKANVIMAWEVITLKNSLYVAQETNDVKWQAEVASEIEQFNQINLLY